MGSHKRKQKRQSGEHRKCNSQPLSGEFDALRVKYAILGKAEWWWLFDDSLAAIAKRLCEDNFVVLDHFMGDDKAKELYQELLRAYNAGRLPETKFEMEGCPRLEPGALAGGKTGGGLTYRMNSVRGDYVAWFSGQEPACKWKLLPTYLQRLDTLVAELAPLIPELRNTASFRSNAMTTCYPGNGAHYVRHCDNTSEVKNGRKLTALFYANPDWKPGKGGELRVFSPQMVGEAPETREFKQLVDIPPISDRVVLFFSDERVPHEVLPCNEKRFAVTVWFFDRLEKESANKEKANESLLQEEEKKIKQEISRFQSQYGEAAEIVPSVSGDTKTENDENIQVQQDQHVDDAELKQTANKVSVIEELTKLSPAQPKSHKMWDLD